ncbi:hypothetical protein AVEN_172492-1 [Araneus ventricosus]|uniref:Uncharacterized protein n=1 Tax=Araneus ventricosus TaxID=182803 RepID=A0A4Y2DQI8_ARAVE|nr:hypothetical protein AVEN_172492-1 [Araneus ventricosus]
MLKYLSTVRVVSRRIRGHISRQLHTFHTITEVQSMNSPLLTNRMDYPIWIIDVVSILAHVHPSDTIGNETRQTRQRVFNHQQSNGSVVEPSPSVLSEGVELKHSFFSLYQS